MYKPQLEFNNVQNCINDIIFKQASRSVVSNGRSCFCFHGYHIVLLCLVRRHGDQYSVRVSDVNTSLGRSVFDRFGQNVWTVQC